MEKDLLHIGSEALRKAALNEEAKRFILKNDALYNVLKKAANRYIGGETLEETLPKVQEHNKNGFACSIEFMGESTRTEKESTIACDEFIRICQQIGNQKLHSAIGLDLSHIGLAVSTDLCFHNLTQICNKAAKHNIEVIIGAEGPDRTDAIITMYKRISPVYPLAGITLQAYLHRTADDFKDLIKEKGRIAMVKGAFQSLPGISLPRGEQLDNVYLDYIYELLAADHKCSIATHHHKIQQQAKKLIFLHKPKKENYEFESLFGICNEQLLALKNEGHPAKVYFVYGKEWHLYVCNRIAEYPLNLFQAVQDMVE